MELRATIHTSPHLETIGVTLKGGVEVKLYLSNLAAKGKLRWQTVRYKDPSTASGGGVTPKTRLCSPDGHTPMGGIASEDTRLRLQARRWL